MHRSPATDTEAGLADVSRHRPMRVCRENNTGRANPPSTTDRITRHPTEVARDPRRRMFHDRRTHSAHLGLFCLGDSLLPHPPPPPPTHPHPQFSSPHNFRRSPAVFWPTDQFRRAFLASVRTPTNHHSQPSFPHCITFSTYQSLILVHLRPVGRQTSLCIIFEFLCWSIFFWAASLGLTIGSCLLLSHDTNLSFFFIYMFDINVTGYEVLFRSL